VNKFRWQRGGKRELQRETSEMDLQCLAAPQQHHRIAAVAESTAQSLQLSSYSYVIISLSSNPSCAAVFAISIQSDIPPNQIMFNPVLLRGTQNLSGITLVTVDKFDDIINWPIIVLLPVALLLSSQHLDQSLHTTATAIVHQLGIAACGETLTISNREFLVSVPLHAQRLAANQWGVVQPFTQVVIAQSSPRIANPKATLATFDAAMEKVVSCLQLVFDRNRFAEARAVAPRCILITGENSILRFTYANCTIVILVCFRQLWSWQDICNPHISSIPWSGYYRGQWGNGWFGLVIVQLALKWPFTFLRIVH
jgi:hypothetical protein